MIDGHAHDYEDERLPETQPSGALVPPPRVPPTAVATAAPLPPEPRSPDRYLFSRFIRRQRRSTLVGAVLDELDELGDRLAHAVGLR